MANEERHLTQAQAYEATYRFIWKYMDREPDPDAVSLQEMLVSLEPADDQDVTNDPASWVDWLQCVQDTLDVAPIPLFPRTEPHSHSLMPRLPREDVTVGASLRIEIFPAELDATIEFYSALGFVVTGRSAGPPAYASLGLDAVRIGACQANPVDPSLRAVPAGTEIVIEVDDVRAFRDRARHAGVSPLDDLQTRPWGLLDFRVTDPDGYYVRFTARR